jgi:phosphate transport system protein
MSLHFEQEVDGLKQKLLAMGSQANTELEGAVRALVQRDDALAQRVKAEDDLVDQFEMEIDEQAIELLAKAPLADDLRLITVAMKISRDLERVGDEATKIARRALELNAEPPLKPYVDIPRLAQESLAMLGEALNAFVTHDAVKARALIPRDKMVDALNKQLHRELVAYMVEQPATIGRCLNLMVVSKSLERVADHAKNIAEDVVYLFEGQDIRHAARLTAKPGVAGPAAPGGENAPAAGGGSSG